LKSRTAPSGGLAPIVGKTLKTDSVANVPWASDPSKAPVSLALFMVAFAESVNAQSTLAVLQRLESKHPKAKKIYVYCDNARYYRCSLVQEFLKLSRIELLFLPPYSGNLNLIERLWKYFRKQLYNKYYAHFADFVAACGHFFEHIKGHRDALRTLLTENFQLIGA
jgi:transposase